MKYLLLALIVVSIGWAEWVDFGNTDADHAIIDVLEVTPSSFTVEITLPGFYNTQVSEDGINFNSISVPAMTPYADAEGAPMLPNAAFLAAVPQNPGVSIDVEPVGRTITYQNVKPYPMQPIPEDNSYQPVPFTYLPDAYDQGEYPSDVAYFTDLGTLRGVNIGRFNIMPFHWDAQTRTLTVTPRVRVTVNFGSSITVDPRLQSRFFTGVYETLVNAQVLGQPQRTLSRDSDVPVIARNMREARDIDAADLLIIAGDDFVDSMMDTFIDTKMHQGYLTAIVAAGTWNETQIHDYIQDAYDNWTVPPSFILFVGDFGDLTSYYSTSTSVYSDSRFVCVDGSDYLADIFHSRFVTPTDDYPIVEAKILKWEFNPLMDADFWGNVLCAGYFQATSSSSTVAERWFCFTCETVRDTYMNIYGKTVQREYTKNTSASPPYYYRNDLPSAGQQIPMDITWDGNAAGIIESINNGVFLVQHRDHGAVTGWGDPAFYTSNLSSLNNGDMTPMVMSVNCLTGKFSQDCFAEHFFRMEGGAVGVLAATEVSYSYFNDYLCYGLYKSFNDEYTSPPAIYTDPTGNYLTGQALTCAKNEMLVAAPFNPYGSWDYYAERTYDLFHWFGDPTMDMRTDVPHYLDVTAPSSLPAGSTEITFNVSDTDGAVYNALVCISHDSLWASGVTDSTGQVTLTFDPIGNLNDITWMVTAHNALPEQGVINGVGIEDDQQPGLLTSVGVPCPNPVAGMLSIQVSLATGGNFSMKVYDTSGRVVDTIYSGDMEAGSHTVTWNAENVPQGVYMIRSVDPSGSVSSNRVVVCR